MVGSLCLLLDGIEVVAVYGIVIVEPCRDKTAVGRRVFDLLVDIFVDETAKDESELPGVFALDHTRCELWANLLILS